MLVVTHRGGVMGMDPVVRTTAATVTPDLAAIAAFDAALADWQVLAVRRAIIDAEGARAPRHADTGPDAGDTGEGFDPGS